MVLEVRFKLKKKKIEKIDWFNKKSGLTRAKASPQPTDIFILFLKKMYFERWVEI
jgi:hypothetical protein